MTDFKLISADSHIIEPPDLYAHRIEPRYRDRAPRMERVETPTGRKYDAWFIDGRQAGTLGAVMQAGQRAGLPAVDEPRVVLAAGWRLHPFHPRRWSKRTRWTVSGA